MTSHRRELVRLAWPAMLSMVVHSLYRLNDQYFVSPLGEEAQSAVAVGGMVGIWFLAFGELVAVGNLAIAGRRLGEGRRDAALLTMRTSLFLAPAIGAVLALATAVGRHDLCAALLPAEGAGLERELAGEYLLWIGLGQAVMLALPAIESSFLAMRDSRTPFFLQLQAIAANALLNWFLVPRIGVGGAGVATVVSRGLAVAVGCSLLRRRGLLLLAPASPRVAWRVARIGLPTCASIAIYSMVYQVMLALTFSRFDAAGRSAVGLGFGIESVFYCAYLGVGMAVSSLVARCLGEGSPARARAMARTAAAINLAVGLACSLCFWTLGRGIVGAFAGSPEVLEANVEYLHLMAWVQPVQALHVALEHAVVGAGVTLPAMLGTTAMNLVRVPLAHALAVGLGMGLPGIWWAINASSVGKGVYALLVYRWRGWETRQI